jgi:hypothetical protein
MPQASQEPSREHRQDTYAKKYSETSEDCLCWWERLKEIELGGVSEERVDTHQTDTLAKHATTRKSIQGVNSALEPRHEPSIITSEVTESLSLLLKDVDDGVGRFTIHELVDDLMLDQVGPCSLFEFVQGTFKE